MIVRVELTKIIMSYCLDCCLIGIFFLDDYQDLMGFLHSVCNVSCA